MCLAFVLLCVFLYHWKGDYGLPVKAWFKARHWFPFNIADPQNPANLLGTIKLSMQSPSFYYSLAYCLCVVIFGVKRSKRRRTPYVKVQTVTLMLIQCIPLFVLPYVALPWSGHNGWFDSGAGKAIGDALFPASEWDAQGREYWRAVGLVLAWPLMFWNVFTHQPIWAWLAIGFVQTFVLIPLMVRKWGKGAYCGWICSCGALAETMGDAHRHKMPHGPIWNRVNMIGQVLLWIALVLLILRVVSWITPGPGWVDGAYSVLLEGKRPDGTVFGGVMRFLNYAWIDDLLFAGILGVCFYFWFSGRVWCRFACPLAALMHIYARFSRFRILADKKKCISCNVCTSVCHQGIDIMSFANKGLPMEDPECVRCSACVQMCPTGVLTFGQVDRKTGQVLTTDPAWLEAAPLRFAERSVGASGIRADSSDFKGVSR
jgi:ferredoxin